MKTELVATRRGFFKLGLGMLGTLAAAKSVAEVCREKTGEQILGPFFPVENSPVNPVKENKDPALPIALSNDNDLTFVQGLSGTAQGQVVYIRGQLMDEACNPLPNATILVWQASETGRYNHKGDAANPDFVHPKTGEIIQRRHDENFQYWGRTTSDQNGEYQFKTIVPGFYPADLSAGWYRPPHIHFLVSATGFQQLVTQMYFQGSELIDNAFIQELNAKDNALQDPRLSAMQRAQLVVEFKKDASIADGLLGKFDIILRA